jgi:hypothetical protein
VRTPQKTARKAFEESAFWMDKFGGIGQSAPVSESINERIKSLKFV